MLNKVMDKMGKVHGSRVDIALVHPPPWSPRLPPLSVTYLAAKLKSEGYRIKVFDFNVELYHEQKSNQFLWEVVNSFYWMEFEKALKIIDLERICDVWAERILGTGTNIVGISVHSHSKNVADLLSNKLKEKNNEVFIIWGGCYCTFCIDLPFAERQLNKNVDIYVRGEGEDVLTEILNRKLNKVPIGNLCGTIIKNNGEFVDNGLNSQPVAINSLPFPDYSSVEPLENYLEREALPILLSRGCNYRCNFCADFIMWGRYRMRSAENIVSEMKKLSRDYGIKEFQCNDLLINGNLKGLDDLAELLIKEDVNLKWGGMARVRQDMTPQLLKKLAKAGCYHLTYGIESGSNRILRLMNKNISTTQTSNCLRKTKDAGIQVNTLWVVGYPHETLIDFIKTAFYILGNKQSIDSVINISPCYIPRLSPLFKDRDNLRIRFQYDDEYNWCIGRNTLKSRELKCKILRWAIALYNVNRGRVW